MKKNDSAEAVIPSTDIVAENEPTAARSTPESDRRTLRRQLHEKLLHNFSVQPKDATNEHLYNALVLVLRDRLRTRRVEYIGRAHRQNVKQVYYCLLYTSPSPRDNV